MSESYRAISVIDRIAKGMATVEDAEYVAQLAALCFFYEMALHEIAAVADGGAALIACKAIQEGREHGSPRRAA